MPLLGALLVLLFLPLFSWAQDAPAIDTGDTAWMMIATGLVAMMTPAGLALFYGGMTPTRNVLNTVGMSYMSYAIGSVVWVSIGYSLAFGPSIGDWGLLGNLDHAFLGGMLVSDVQPGLKIPSVLFVAFQGTFAAIAVALVSGAIIERVKFVSWIVFVVIWLLVIYSPVAHWVWGGGFLYQLGALDFAGGTVIHITAGVTGLVLAIMVGRRTYYGEVNFGAYGIKFTVLGAALLWFGWFGFNGGSAGAASAQAANAVLVTNTAAALGVVGWMLLEWLFTGKYTLFGAASGAVAGLVAITPASGFVSLSASMFIGLMGGLLGYFGVYELKKRTNVDDALDTFGVHALAGTWGAIATGIFADERVSGLAGANGLWYGNAQQLVYQLVAVGATAAYTAVMTVFCYYLTSLLTNGMRVDAITERSGIDKSFHGESV